MALQLRKYTTPAKDYNSVTQHSFSLSLSLLSSNETILRLIVLNEIFVLCLFRDFTDFVGERDKKVTLALR